MNKNIILYENNRSVFEDTLQCPVLYIHMRYSTKNPARALSAIKIRHAPDPDS